MQFDNSFGCNHCIIIVEDSSNKMHALIEKGAIYLKNLILLIIRVEGLFSNGLKIIGHLQKIKILTFKDFLKFISAQKNGLSLMLF